MAAQIILDSAGVSWLWAIGPDSRDDAVSSKAELRRSVAEAASASNGLTSATRMARTSPEVSTVWHFVRYAVFCYGQNVATLYVVLI